MPEMGKIIESRNVGFWKEREEISKEKDFENAKDVGRHELLLK